MTISHDRSLSWTWRPRFSSCLTVCIYVSISVFALLAQAEPVAESPSSLKELSGRHDYLGYDDVLKTQSSNAGNPRPAALHFKRQQLPSPRPFATEPLATCSCPELIQTSCRGSTCECANELNIVCYFSHQTNCQFSLEDCSFRRSGNGLATPIDGPFPPCGATGLIACAKDRYCAPLDYTAPCPNGQCLGICIPPKDNTSVLGVNLFPLPGYSISLAPPGSRAWNVPKTLLPGAAKIQPVLFKGCPDGSGCPAPTVCMREVNIDGSLGKYGCTIPQEFCGGFKNEACSLGTCMSDPRLNCLGDYCPGICVT